MTLPVFDSPSAYAEPVSETEGASRAELEDRWTRRARPMFLYVIYAMILWSLPIGLVAAFSPATAQAMADATGAYLSALPEPLYALFGTGYLGYATLRQWGKARGEGR